MDNSRKTYLPRTLSRYLNDITGQFPITLLTGPRQVGKTTLLRHLSTHDRSYVTLDDPLALALARDDPALFLQRFPAPVLIDEIQYAPQLLPLIKIDVDNHPEPGRYWLTGSQQFHLMQGVAESLAGRVGILHLQGLSWCEAREHSTTAPFLPTPAALAARAAHTAPVTLHELYAHIWRGSFPALQQQPALDRTLFYSSYVQTYLQRDVRDLARVGDEAAFLKFLRATAARTGQLLNMSDLARDASISPTTAKHWLSILETSGIIYLLEPYHNNLTKRLVKAPKLYFLDTGLASYLTEWTSPQTLEAGAMSGAIFETFVVGEILKSYWHNTKRPPLYYYRDKDRKEIDLLIVQDNTIYPLECKKTANPDPAAIKNFRVLTHLDQPIGPGGIICLVGQSMPLNATNSAIPAQWL